MFAKVVYDGQRGFFVLTDSKLSSVGRCRTSTNILDSISCVEKIKHFADSPPGVTEHGLKDISPLTRRRNRETYICLLFVQYVVYTLPSEWVSEADVLLGAFFVLKEWIGPLVVLVANTTGTSFRGWRALIFKTAGRTKALGFRMVQSIITYMHK